MIVTQDERTAARFEASYPVQIEANGRPIAARSLNMGLGGLCLEPGASLPDRTPVVCRVDAEGKPLEAQGEVAWQYAEDGVYRMGVRFCALSPALAGWLSSVATSHTAVAPTHAPVSDTQPMKVPVVPEDEGSEQTIGEPMSAEALTCEPMTAEALPAEAMHAEPAAAHESGPEPAPRHGAARVEQLDLWKKGARAEAEAEVETDVLFDDMPSPEARMMQTKADARTVAAMSAKHRLLAMAKGARTKLTSVTGKLVAPLARLRARKAAAARTAPTQRIAVAAARPHGTPIVAQKVAPAAKLLVTMLAFVRALPGRVPAVGKHLRNRRVQLVLAASAVVLLVGSGVAFLFAGGEPAAEGDSPTAELPVPADNGGSYWDPPAMPVPDQELAEAAPPPAPAPAPAPEHAAPPPVEAAVAIPDMPLPEPPVVGAAGAEAEAPTPEPMADAEALPAELPAPSAAAAEPEAAPADEGAAEVAGASARERRHGRHESPAPASRATSRHAEREAASARGHERHAEPVAAREERAPARERAATHRTETESRSARAEERSARRPDARAAAAAPASGSTFRLNLSGAPGAIHTYPLANPNGIVIDVANLQHPGDATKLTSDDPRIRFVKIINREQGVRFIVYLTGALPEYQVEPSGRGLRVALR